MFALTFVLSPFYHLLNQLLKQFHLGTIQCIMLYIINFGRSFVFSMYVFISIEFVLRNLNVMNLMTQFD